MASWRERASQIAQDDFDLLTNLTLPFARQQLDQDGEFMPFAAAIASDGDQRLFGAETGTDDSSPADLLELLWGGLTSERTAIRAVAVASDIRVPTSDRDGVRVELEHLEGACIQVVLPYIKRRFGRAIQYEPLESWVGYPRIWVD